MTTDSQIQAHVLNELLADAHVAANDIAVSVSDGVVSLEGEVDSLVQRSYAGQAAERVRGVRAVVNHIAVHLPTDRSVRDVDVAHAAVNALISDTEVPDKDIKVRVHDGWIYLVGEVDAASQRIAAERAVENIAGVKGLTNLVRVKMPERAGLSLADRHDNGI